MRKIWLLKMTMTLALVASACAPQWARDFKSDGLKSGSSATSSTAVLSTSPLALADVKHYLRPLEFEFKVNKDLIAKYEIAYCDPNNLNDCVVYFKIECSGQTACSWQNIYSYMLPTYNQGSVQVSLASDHKKISVALSNLQTTSDTAAIRIRAVSGAQTGNWYTSVFSQ